MSRLILCPPCRVKLYGTASKYQEYAECISGKSKRSMVCDHCNLEINPGDESNACCLLPSAPTAQFDWQRPERWADQYLTKP